MCLKLVIGLEPEITGVKAGLVVVEQIVLEACLFTEVIRVETFDFEEAEFLSIVI